MLLWHPWTAIAVEESMGKIKKNINNNNEHNTTEQNQQKGNNIKFV